MNFNQLNKEKNNKEIWLFSAVTALLISLTVCGFFIFPKLALQKTEAVPVIAEAPKDPEQKPKFESAQFIASAVYVKDLKTGEVLFEKNPKEQMPLASITKLMTALVVSRSFENKNVSVAFSPTQYTVPEIFSLRDALRALLVFSSNESADSVAQITGKNFVENMNYTATTLGLKSMKFNNPSGLDVSPSVAGGYGSAEDVATLIEYILKEYPDVLESTRNKDTTIQSKNTNIIYTLDNTNEVLNKIPGLIASKTGYTDLAGGNLVIVYDTGVNHPIVAVVLGSTHEGRFIDIVNIASTTLSVK